MSEYTNRIKEAVEKEINFRGLKKSYVIFSKPEFIKREGVKVLNEDNIAPLYVLPLDDAGFQEVNVDTRLMRGYQVEFVNVTPEAEALIEKGIFGDHQLKALDKVRNSFEKTEETRERLAIVAKSDAENAKAKLADKKAGAAAAVVTPPAGEPKSDAGNASTTGAPKLPETGAK